MKKSEAGQALVLTVLLATMLLVAGGVVFGTVFDRLSDQSRAQTAADAAALAGAAADESAARLTAQANGGVLVEFSRPNGDVLVRVRIDSSHADARARQGRLH
jgi:hypothetical protein